MPKVKNTSHKKINLESGPLAKGEIGVATDAEASVLHAHLEKVEEPKVAKDSKVVGK